MKKQKILEVLRQQHRAIVTLYARLMTLDNTFRPSKSGSPWDALIAGNELIRELEAE